VYDIVLAKLIFKKLNNNFKKVSVILPVINETFSLIETINVILNLSKKDILEIIIVVDKKTTTKSIAIINTLILQKDNLIILHHQKMPFIGGALQEAFNLARGSHVIMMASDLETDPNLVPILIEKSKIFPDNIITVTRWKFGGGFKNYSKIKLFANWIFQKIFSLLYWTNLSDMTYAFRIYPIDVVKKINWQELKHPFLFETIIKPLRIGVKVIEIPGIWKARTEGVSQNTFLRNFEYFKIGIKVRFISKSKILKNN
jgi:glycosyltransferase involved in cell wall biosynthesis